MKSLLSAPHPRELGQSFDRDSSQRSTMLSAKCSRRILIGHRDMTAGALPTRERAVHRGDIVALHRVQRSIRSCLRAAMSGGHHGFGVRVEAK